MIREEKDLIKVLMSYKEMTNQKEEQKIESNITNKYINRNRTRHRIIVQSTFIIDTTQLKMAVITHDKTK